MKQARMNIGGEWLEVIRILENLGVHHKPGAERFWTPRENYQLWRAVYDAISTEEPKVLPEGS